MKDIILGLKRKLTESVQKNTVSVLLFSGGVDTSILAALNPNISTITISLESYGEDIKYAKLVTKDLKLKHFHRAVNVEEAIDSIPEVIKILGTFDPAIPNDVVVYFGLKQAKELGIDAVMTGDGSDELFAGYNFMQKIDDLGGYIKRISQNMGFNSNHVGDFFGIKVVQPFLDKKVIEFALSLKPEIKLRRENGTCWGKWILRKAFEDILPKEIIWQDKRPLEIGSGMTRIREVISNRITDTEFKKGLHPVTLINKEHLYYYKVYKDIVGDIPTPKEGEKECIGCGAAMRPLSFHCGVCGYTSDWRI